MELYIEPIKKRKYRDSNGKFVKGMVPWNKGLRLKGVIFNDTQFKKGHKPKNTKPDWFVTVRKDKNGNFYKFIKVPGRRNFTYLHRWIWEMEHGEIPRGYVVRFKDGDTLNCIIENLELITRSEHMVLNYNREKSSESMRELWKRERIRQAIGLKPLTKLLNRKPNGRNAKVRN